MSTVRLVEALLGFILSSQQRDEKGHASSVLQRLSRLLRLGRPGGVWVLPVL